MQPLFGPVMQNAFVVSDLNAAIEHWARTVRVGPFFVFERVPFKECWYRGQQATDIDLAVAIAYWGEVQVELIHQRNQVPSIYTDFSARIGTGLQHMGVMSADLDADLARLKAAGVLPVQHGTAPGMRFAYVGTDFHPGGMIELIEATPQAVAFFGRIRAAARDWDGRDAVMSQK
jgi:methylmalonyl-CoA/ethylmalonyl-CoA epimerase